MLTRSRRALSLCFAALTLLLGPTQVEAGVDQYGRTTVVQTCDNPDGGWPQTCGNTANPMPVAVAGSALANALVLTNSVIGTSSGTCYGTGGPALVGRSYAEVCNASGNTGSPVLYLTWDGTTPVASETVHGKSLAVGQCYVVPLPATNALTCVSTAVSTNVEIVERQ